MNIQNNNIKLGLILITAIIIALSAIIIVKQITTTPVTVQKEAVGITTTPTNIQCQAETGICTWMSVDWDNPNKKTNCIIDHYTCLDQNNIGFKINIEDSEIDNTGFSTLVEFFPDPDKKIKRLDPYQCPEGLNAIEQTRNDLYFNYTCYQIYYKDYTEKVFSCQITFMYGDLDCEKNTDDCPLISSPTPTPIVTISVSNTPIPSPTATNTPTPTATNTPTPTNTPSPTPTRVFTPTPTNTPSPTPTRVFTPTPTIPLACPASPNLSVKIYCPTCTCGPYDCSSETNPDQFCQGLGRDFYCYIKNSKSRCTKKGAEDFCIESN